MAARSLLSIAPVRRRATYIRPLWAAALRWTAVAAAYFAALAVAVLGALAAFTDVGAHLLAAVLVLALVAAVLVAVTRVAVTAGQPVLEEAGR